MLSVSLCHLNVLAVLQVRVEIESLAEGVDLSEPLTRARFEELTTDVFKKTLGPGTRAMEDAALKKVCPVFFHPAQGISACLCDALTAMPWCMQGDAVCLQ